MPPRIAQGVKLRDRQHVATVIRTFLRGGDNNSNHSPDSFDEKPQVGNNNNNSAQQPRTRQCPHCCCDEYAVASSSLSTAARCSCPSSLNAQQVLLGRLVLAALVLFMHLPMRYFLVGEDKSVPLEAVIPVVGFVVYALLAGRPALTAPIVATRCSCSRCKPRVPPAAGMEEHPKNGNGNGSHHGSNGNNSSNSSSNSINNNNNNNNKAAQQLQQQQQQVCTRKLTTADGEPLESDTAIEEELVPALIDAVRGCSSAGLSYHFAVDAVVLSIASFVVTLLQSAYYRSVIWEALLRFDLSAGAPARLAAVAAASGASFRLRGVNSLTGTSIHYMPEMAVCIAQIVLALQMAHVGRTLCSLAIPVFVIYHHLFGARPSPVHPRDAAWILMTHVALGIVFAAQLRLARMFVSLRSLVYAVADRMRWIFVDAPVQLLTSLPFGIGSAMSLVFVHLPQHGFRPSPMRWLALVVGFRLLAAANHAGSAESVPVLTGICATAFFVKVVCSILDVCFVPPASPRSSSTATTPHLDSAVSGGTNGHQDEDSDNKKAASAAGGGGGGGGEPDGLSGLAAIKFHVMDSLSKMSRFIVISVMCIVVAHTIPLSLQPFLAHCVVALLAVAHFAEVDVPTKSPPRLLLVPAIMRRKPGEATGSGEGTNVTKSQEELINESRMVMVPPMVAPLLVWMTLVLLEFDTRYGLDAALVPLLRSDFFSAVFNFFFGGGLLAALAATAAARNGTMLSGSSSSIPHYGSMEEARTAARDLLARRKLGARILSDGGARDFAELGSPSTMAHELASSITLGYGTVLFANLCFAAARHLTAVRRGERLSRQQLAVEEADAAQLRGRLHEQKEMWRKKREEHIRNGGAPWISPEERSDNNNVSAAVCDSDIELEVSDDHQGRDDEQHHHQHQQQQSEAVKQTTPTARKDGILDVTSSSGDFSLGSRDGSFATSVEQKRNPTAQQASTSSASASAEATATSESSSQQQQLAKLQQQRLEEERAEKARQKEEERRRKKDDQRQRDLAARQERLNAEAALRQKLDADRVKARAEAERERDEQRQQERAREEARQREAAMEHEGAMRERICGLEVEERDVLRVEMPKSRQSAMDRHRARVKKQQQKEEETFVKQQQQQQQQQVQLQLQQQEQAKKAAQQKEDQAKKAALVAAPKVAQSSNNNTQRREAEAAAAGANNHDNNSGGSSSNNARNGSTTNNKDKKGAAPAPKKAAATKDSANERPYVAAPSQQPQQQAETKLSLVPPRSARGNLQSPDEPCVLVKPAPHSVAAAAAKTNNNSNNGGKQQQQQQQQKAKQQAASTTPTVPAPASASVAIVASSAAAAAANSGNGKSAANNNNNNSNNNNSSSSSASQPAPSNEPASMFSMNETDLSRLLQTFRHSDLNHQHSSHHSGSDAHTSDLLRGATAPSFLHENTLKIGSNSGMLNLSGNHHHQHSMLQHHQNHHHQHHHHSGVDGTTSQHDWARSVHDLVGSDSLPPLTRSAQKQLRAGFGGGEQEPLLRFTGSDNPAATTSPSTLAPPRYQQQHQSNMMTATASPQFMISTSLSGGSGAGGASSPSALAASNSSAAASSSSPPARPPPAGGAAGNIDSNHPLQHQQQQHMPANASTLPSLLSRPTSPHATTTTTTTGAASTSMGYSQQQQQQQHVPSPYYISSQPTPLYVMGPDGALYLQQPSAATTAATQGASAMMGYDSVPGATAYSGGYAASYPTTTTAVTDGYYMPSATDASGAMSLNVMNINGVLYAIVPTGPATAPAASSVGYPPVHGSSHHHHHHHHHHM